MVNQMQSTPLYWVSCDVFGEMKETQKFLSQTWPSHVLFISRAMLWIPALFPPSSLKITHRS